MDDTLFDFLHLEMVAHIIRGAKKKDDIDSCITKLEAMGYRVGQSLIERVLKEAPRFKDELDVMKFICKDFWSSIFKKQVDNLRTNHQGVYVLQDNKFKILTQMSAGKQYLEMAPRYVYKYMLEKGPMNPKIFVE
ncbi:trafficking protein particle complex subunit 6b-like [Anneissia japonica]|uniref:trafficking protein particle complex subunit 6b-like n=1 Tax=Anneissia japonica TaxID=1529436 RepID=UPI0014255FF7|nr:trafficking protein particle complex subunit 6b-like [Anneissia japonica]